MALVPTRQVVDDARRRAGGVAAFNVITLEHAEAIVAGAEAAGRPVILQISENAALFHRGNVAPISAEQPSPPPRLYPSRCISTTSRTRTCCTRRRKRAFRR